MVEYSDNGNIVEFTALKLLAVKYGFGWVRRDSEGVIRGSTNTIINYLEQIDKEYEEMRSILQDFLTTKECRVTWIEEMHGTIDAVLNGGE